MKKIFFVFFLILSVCIIYGQQNTLPRNYRGVELLESYETVMSKLKSDTLLLVDPDSDFGDMDEENPELIKAKIPPYIRHAYYQFYENKLFVISLFFDKKYFSYTSMYQNLKQKYGKPIYYDSKNTIWENQNTWLILDNLPSLKYIDREVFQKIKETNKRNLYPKDMILDKILEGL